jgi:regulator of cell morphogenesis and NO signaling
MIIKSQTVGEIAAGQPATIRIFQAHGIDFCCGGARPLDEVCTERGLDVAAVLGELEEAVASPQGDGRVWTEVRLGEVVAHILGHYHAPLRGELTRLSALMEKVRRVHGDRHPEVVAMAAELARLVDDLMPHMMKEERVLFPYIGQLEALESRGESLAGSPFGTVENPISVMLQEHEAAGEILAALRRLSGGYVPPADACNSFRGLYHGLADLERELHEHIHLENNVLFPRAVALETQLRAGGRAA